MSTYPVQVSCTGCAVTQTIVNAAVTLRYAITDDEYAVAYRTEGWCPRCDSIQDVEDLPEENTLLEELERLGHKLAGSRFDRLKDRLGRPPSARRLAARRQSERVSRTLRWRRTRSSPARCLQCGSTEWQQLDWLSATGSGERDVSYTQQFRHACGGRLRRAEEQSYRVSVPRRRVVLTAEGQVIRIETDDDADEFADWFLLG